MNKETIVKLFKEFISNYDEKEKNRIWEHQNKKFRKFWEEKIIPGEKVTLSNDETNEIVKILDTHGKGRKLGNEAVAATMINQNFWHAIFQDIRENPEFSETLTNILKENDLEKKAQYIDHLFSINNKKNSLTGPSAVAINSFLAAYNAENYLSVVSLGHREKIIDYLGLDYNKKASTGTRDVVSNKIIIDYFNNLGLSDNARTITRFLYCQKPEVKKLWYDIKQKKTRSDVVNKKYWLYSLGENAHKWEEFYEKGIMAIAWDELGDLKKYKTPKEIENELLKHHPEKKRCYNDALANYEFANEISIGDIVITKRGRTQLLGYGVVESDYYYDPEEELYTAKRKVNWLKKGEWDPEHNLVLKTLTDITKYTTEHPDYEKYYERLMDTIGAEKVKKTIEKTIPLPLNTIIYGPPGTGKTYQLKNTYFTYFTDEEARQTQEEYYYDLIKDLTWWQIISIIMLDVKKAKVQEIFDHPLMQAKYALSNNKTPKNTIWYWLQYFTKEECPNVKLKKRSSIQLFWKDENTNWTIDEEVAQSVTPDFYDILEKYKNWKPETTEKKRYVFTTFHQSFSYEDFIEGIKPKIISGEDALEDEKQIAYEIKPGLFKQIVQKAEKDPEHQYAIFIDEINRGNIANIFGELITLIEKDKRKGCENELSATLPYSGEHFSVPKNLYIVGTMNTADRSVEVLDTALRRRFSFIEMNPEPELLSEPKYQCKGIDLEALLTTINARIEKLMDKDYCIGHSYFMTIDNKQNPLRELKYIFTNKIIPLLQEYFYGDWGKIMLVLGNGFVEKVIEKVEFLAIENYDDYEMYQDKPVYRFTDPNSWDMTTFKEIYEK